MPKDADREIEDELRDIEQSATMMGKGGPGLNNAGTQSQRTLDSSCNSMYIEDDSYYGDSHSDSNEMSWQLSTSNVEHPSTTQNNDTTSGPRRASVYMTPVGMGAMLDVDFDESDEDDNSGHPKPAAPSGGTGNPNHRPMVGGFAAAAYEAARADHYKKQQNKKPSGTESKPSI